MRCFGVVCQRVEFWSLVVLTSPSSLASRTLAAFLLSSRVSSPLFPSLFPLPPAVRPRKALSGSDEPAPQGRPSGTFHWRALFWPWGWGEPCAEASWSPRRAGSMWARPPLAASLSAPNTLASLPLGCFWFFPTIK